MWLLAKQASGKRRPSITEGFLFSDSVIDSATIQAYLETEYRVKGDQAFTLKIGQASAELLTLHKRHRVDCSAYLTACNPGSQLVDEATNQTWQQALEKELTHRSLPFISGIAQHPFNDWPGEQSFLVFGLNLEAAKALGVPLHFELGEAFQFDWNTEYLAIGCLRRRPEVAHVKLATSRS